MNAYIKGLAIFKDETSAGKRFLELSEGLNIITGHSKTGKSAILDIIDWCLGAKDCTIPKGTITSFASVYAILLSLNNRLLLLARKEGNIGKRFIHVREIDSQMDVSKLRYSDIKEDNFMPLNNALEEINKVIDLSINQENIPFEIEKGMPKADIRSALVFMFQSQDIISSNSRLFYYYPIQSHFPVLAGWYGVEYYMLLERLEFLKNKIKQLETQNEKAQKENVKLEYNLRKSLSLYYALIGFSYNKDWSLKECINRANNLVDFERIVPDNQLQKRQDEIGTELQKLEAQQILIRKQISKISTQLKYSSEYDSFLSKYEQRSRTEFQSEYHCPICGKENEGLIVEAVEILNAEKWLKNELLQIPTHISKYQQELKQLKKEDGILLDQIKGLKNEQSLNKKIIEKIEKQENLNEVKQLAKWRVSSDAEIYNDRHISFDEKHLNELISEHETNTEIKSTYHEVDKYDDAKKIIEDHLNRVVEKLDFEHKPANLYFEIKPGKEDSYKLYHNSEGKERTYLRQIGSASNALACHLGLFLSFLHYFCGEEKSKVPSILFLDQPSQVYFPSGTDNTDLEKVGQIYKTMLDELFLIKENTGILPQIIVADHIKDLGEENVNLYDDYFKANWRDGEGLI